MGDVDQISATETYHRRRPGGEAPAAGSYESMRAKPPVAGRFFVIFWAKNCAFNAVWITFQTFSDPFERTKLLRFESQWKKTLTLLQVKSKTHFKFCILGFNFVSDLTQVRGSTVHCLLQYVWH